MLVIRLQRVGRKGHAQFRVVVQDSRRTPSSGKVVAYLGHYNPHTKDIVINKEKAQFYLDHGAQPSDRIILLFKSQGVKMPKWVVLSTKIEGKIRNPEKLRRNQPKEDPITDEPKTAEPVAEESTEEKTQAVDTAPAEAETPKQEEPEKTDEAKA